MADKYATVEDPSYTFRGVRIGRGTVVKLTAAQLEAAKDHAPPRLKETKAPEGDAGVVDIRPERFAAEIQASETGTPPERPALKQ